MANDIFKNILDTMSDGILYRDKAGEIGYANSLAEKLKAIEENDDGTIELEDRFYRFQNEQISTGELHIWHDVTEIVKLRELMVIDPELGIFTTRFFREELERELDRVHRTVSQMALVLIDVEAGEDGPSFLEMANVLKQTVRNYDMVFKGIRSDFVLLLYAMIPNKIEITGQRLMQALKDIDVARVSVGITLSEKSPSAEAMMRQAQRALYVVNARGGNDYSIF